MQKITKSGFVGIIGMPNVGKSTLLNTIIKEKISIITKVPQTTRNIIKGIYTEDHYQMIFIDSPGYHDQKYKFNKALNKIMIKLLSDIDIALFLVSSIDERNEKIISFFETMPELPVFLLINKIDILKSQAEDIEEYYKSKFNFKQIFKISALRKQGLDSLLSSIIDSLPNGPFYYPDDQITDRDNYFLFSEIVREKLFIKLKEEMPHKIMVSTDYIEYDIAKDMYFIHFIVWVEKDNEKGIIIGRSGKFIKDIGIKARLEIEEILKKKVFLSIGVKAKEKWRNDKAFIERALNYERDILLT